MPGESFEQHRRRRGSLIPRHPALRELMLAAWLGVVAIVTAECVLRGLGFRASVVDDAALYRRTLDAALRPGAATLLLGSSQSAFLFDLEAVRSYSGERCHQLAIWNASPVPVMEYLADRQRRGTHLIIEFSHELLAARRTAEAKARLDDAWVRQRPITGLERVLADVWQPLSVRHAPSLRERRAVLRWLLTGEAPPTAGEEIRSSREALLDDRRVRVREQNLRARGIRSSPMTCLTEAELSRGRQRFLAAFDRLAALGNRISVVRIPVGGQRWREHEGCYPRARDWDSLAAILRARGATVLHGDDLALVPAPSLPDDVHVGRRDRTRVTQAVLQALDEGLKSASDP